MDVTSLYTSIPKQLGIQAVLDQVQADPLAPYMELMNLIFNKNHFEFNGTIYLQTGGTAMGIRFAPSFANLFMGQFENLLLRSYH